MVKWLVSIRQTRRVDFEVEAETKEEAENLYWEGLSAHNVVSDMLEESEVLEVVKG